MSSNVSPPSTADKAPAVPVAPPAQVVKPPAGGATPAKEPELPEYVPNPTPAFVVPAFNFSVEDLDPAILDALELKKDERPVTLLRAIFLDILGSNLGAPSALYDNLHSENPALESIHKLYKPEEMKFFVVFLKRAVEAAKTACYDKTTRVAWSDPELTVDKLFASNVLRRIRLAVQSTRGLAAKAEAETVPGAEYLELMRRVSTICRYITKTKLARGLAEDMVRITKWGEAWLEDIRKAGWKPRFM